MLLGALCEALSELEEGAGPWPGSPLVTGEGACRGEVAHPPYVPASGRAGPPTRGTDSKPVSLLRPLSLRQNMRAGATRRAWAW